MKFEPKILILLLLSLLLLKIRSSQKMFEPKKKNEVWTKNMLVLLLLSLLLLEIRSSQIFFFYLMRN